MQRAVSLWKGWTVSRNDAERMAKMGDTNNETGVKFNESRHVFSNLGRIYLPYAF